MSLIQSRHGRFANSVVSDYGSVVGQSQSQSFVDIFALYKSSRESIASEKNAQRQEKKNKKNNKMSIICLPQLARILLIFCDILLIFWPHFIDILLILWPQFIDILLIFGGGHFIDILLFFCVFLDFCGAFY